METYSTQSGSPVSCIERLKVVIRGAVQGVGFRPFVYRLAHELGLKGRITNSSMGVVIEIEGERKLLDEFVLRVEREKPPRSSIHSIEASFLDPVGLSEFTIGESDPSGEKTAIVLPDIATCPDCVREVFDPRDRRYLYPFTNCTNCGPRFSIIASLPYDRLQTTMAGFAMCPACRREYEDPSNRRFHAQPNACPVCGPHIELWNRHGSVLVKHQLAIQVAAEVIRGGGILAAKGIGGFHLIVDARNEEAVAQLRRRKHREEKPFALMYPSLGAIAAECEVSEAEARLLLSPESPIVLIRRIPSGNGRQSELAPSVAPANPYIGAMLPYAPLYHILLRELGFPIVATSGNLSDEPICTDEREAVGRLRGIADVFLVHNRPIARHVDDSVVRVMAGRELVMRRARGYAPLPIHVEPATGNSLLAVGAHLKNTIALTVGDNVFISQHIGDLETAEASNAFRDIIRDFSLLFDRKPEGVVCDLHPDYLSTRYAKEAAVPVITIQHHFAHVMSCMAENELDGSLLGVSWDGTGYGPDRTIWGGEFLLTDATTYQRVACFRPFRLPGGEHAIREPRRSAIGVLYEILGEAAFDRDDLFPMREFKKPDRALFIRMLRRGVNCPQTSSVGRLFDAVSSLIGLRQYVSFEGQAAMELEFAATGHETNEAYGVRIAGEVGLCTVDWEPVVRGILNDLDRNELPGVIALKFHNSLVESIVDVAKRVQQPRVVLTGGCFQNKYLTERTVKRLRQEGFRPYWHQRVPPNDGGIALGQVFAAISSRRSVRAHDSVAARSGAAAQETIREESLK